MKTILKKKYFVVVLIFLVALMQVLAVSADIDEEPVDLGSDHPVEPINKDLGNSAGTVINNYIAGGGGGDSHVTVEIQYPYRNLVESINDTMTTFAARAILGDNANSGDFAYFRGGGTGGGSEPAPVQISELSRYGIGGGIAPAPIPGIKEGFFFEDYPTFKYLNTTDITDDWALTPEAAKDSSKVNEYIQLYEYLDQKNVSVDQTLQFPLADGEPIYSSGYAIGKETYMSALQQADPKKAEYIQTVTNRYGFPLDAAVHTWNSTKDFYQKNPDASTQDIWDGVINSNYEYLTQSRGIDFHDQVLAPAENRYTAGNPTLLDYMYLYLSGNANVGHELDDLENNPFGYSKADVVSYINTLFSPEVNNDVTYRELKDEEGNPIKDEKGRTYIVQETTDPTTSISTDDASTMHEDNRAQGNLAIITVFNDLFNRVANHFYNPQNYIEGARSTGWNITIKIALALIPLVIILSMVTYFRSGAGDLVAAKDTIINLVVNIGLAISSYFITTQVINISIGIARAIMPGQSDFFTMTDADFQMGAISTVLTIVFIFIVVLAGLIMVFEFYMASAAAQIVFAVSTITTPIMIILSTYKPLEFLRSMWMKQLTSMLILLPSNAIILRVIAELINIDGGGGIGGTIFRFTVVLGCVAIMIGLNSQAAKQVFSGLTTAIDNTIGKAQRIAQLRGAGAGSLAAAAAGAGGGDGGGGSSNGGGSNLSAGQTIGPGGVTTGSKSPTTQIASRFGNSSGLPSSAGSSLSMQTANKIAQALGGAGGTGADIQRRASTPGGRSQLANEIKQMMNGGKLSPQNALTAMPSGGSASSKGQNPPPPPNGTTPAPAGTGASKPQSTPISGGSAPSAGIGGSKSQGTPLPTGSAPVSAGGGASIPQGVPISSGTSHAPVSSGSSKPQSTPLPSGNSAPAPSMPQISSEAGQSALDLLNGAAENNRVSRNYFDFKTNLSEMTSANFSLVASGMGAFDSIKRDNPEAFQRLIDVTTVANNTANNAMAGAHVVQETGRDASNYNESSIYQSLGQSYAMLQKQGAIPDIDMNRMPEAFVRGFEIQRGISQPASFYEASFNGALNARDAKDMYRSSINSLSDFLMKR